MNRTRARRTAASEPYARPRHVFDLDECYFYHTLKLPGFGVVPGDWDLRANVDRYFGEVDFHRKRVLEVGCASGFLTFEMERRGADVVAFDLSKDFDFDPVPYERTDHRAFQREFKQTNSQKLNNAWWLAHRAVGSNARVVYGTAYDIPKSIGPVDMATFGCILLHLRDPFLALQNALRLTRETVVITEQRQMSWMRRLQLWLGGPRRRGIHAGLSPHRASGGLVVSDAESDPAHDRRARLRGFDGHVPHADFRGPPNADVHGRRPADRGTGGTSVKPSAD